MRGILGMIRGCYTVMAHKKGWVIKRPDGTFVNDNVFKTKVSATTHLKTLIALNYTKV